MGCLTVSKTAALPYVTLLGIWTYSKLQRFHADLLCSNKFMYSN